MRGGVDPVDNSIFVPGVSELQICGRMSEPRRRAYPPRVALALRAPANQRSACGIAVSIPCGAVSTRENRFLSPGCQSCRKMEGCQNRRWRPILPGLPSLYAPQPISDRPSGLGFRTVRGGADTGELDFRPRGVGFVEIWRGV